MNEIETPEAVDKQLLGDLESIAIRIQDLLTYPRQTSKLMGKYKQTISCLCGLIESTSDEIYELTYEEAKQS